jgi:hypothetical protein
MKKVFSSHLEVCHIWASRSQGSGRAGSISFNGNTILSYHWWPMATFINDNTVLRVNWIYSNSTAKHLNYVGRAIPGYYKEIFVKNPVLGAESVNIADFLIQIKKRFDSFKTSHKYKQYIYNNQQRIINNLIDYCGLFNLSIPDYSEFSLLKNDVYLAEICKQDEHLKELEAKKEAVRVKILANLQDEINKAENDWMNGTSNNVRFYHKKIGSYSFSKIRLRSKDDNIETSMGAKVSIREAKILFDMIQRKDNIKGHKIDNYTVIGINGTLKIGCHEIERDEINRLATLLNWL